MEGDKSIISVHVSGVALQNLYNLRVTNSRYRKWMQPFSQQIDCQAVSKATITAVFVVRVPNLSYRTFSLFYAVLFLFIAIFEFVKLYIHVRCTAANRSVRFQSLSAGMSEILMIIL